MASTIWIILRAVTLVGIESSAQFTVSYPALRWQSAQSYPSPAAMTPMAPMKSSTVRPLRVLVVTFLKASPAVFGLAGWAVGLVCAPAVSVRMHKSIAIEMYGFMGG